MSLFSLNNVCIISCCFRSHFNLFSTQPARRHPVLTSSGRIHPVAVGDHVYLVEDIQYHTTKLSPDSDSVCLQKINSRNRPFKRSIRQFWLPPPTTSEYFAFTDLPRTNCFCPEPLPPPVLPEVMDTSIQADKDKESALNDRVTVTTDFLLLPNWARLFKMPDVRLKCFTTCALKQI